MKPAICFFTILVAVGWLTYWIVTRPNADGFTEGQMVESVIDGRRGMVIYTRIKSCTVRFASDSSSTSTHLLGPDGDIKSRPYTLTRVRNFEIQPYYEDQNNE